jgi:hypothetical protein
LNFSSSRKSLTEFPESEALKAKKRLRERKWHKSPGFLSLHHTPHQNTRVGQMVREVVKWAGIWIQSPRSKLLVQLEGRLATPSENLSSEGQGKVRSFTST